MNIELTKQEIRLIQQALADKYEYRNHKIPEVKLSADIYNKLAEVLNEAERSR